MSRIKRHTLCVDILCYDSKGQRQAQDMLHGWLEHYGHTATSFGFEFKTVGVLTGKQVNLEDQNLERDE